MQRVFNELSSDEVRRDGGIKVGNYGTGGRTYVKYRTGASAAETDASVRLWRGVVAAAVLLAGAAWLYTTERSATSTLGCVAAAEQATEVHAPFAAASVRDGALLYASSTSPHVVGDPAVRDPFFGVSFPLGTTHARRNVEFCQWQEIQHTERVEVGRREDCDDTPAACAIYEERTTYTYHKAWRSHRINSLAFDSPAAYHNPQRNPVDDTEFHARAGVRLGPTESDGRPSLTVDVQDAADGFTPWARQALLPEMVKAASGQGAVAGGFNEADHTYFYSRVSTDGTGMPLIKAGLSYLVDGVLDVESISRGIGVEAALQKAGLDWITKGSCTAGDIRVSFTTRRVSDRGISVVGASANGRIVPAPCGPGVSRVLALPQGCLSLDQFIVTVIENVKWATNWQRAGAATAAAIAIALSPTGSRWLACAGTLAVWGAIWALLYGWSWGAAQAAAVAVVYFAAPAPKTKQA